MQLGDARWSLGGPWWSPGVIRGLPDGYRAQNKCLRKFEKWCFCALAARGGWGVLPPSYLVRSWTPGGARLARRLWDDNLAPFSSDKIQAKILELGYGGARRSLKNLCPKYARILSAAITRTTLPPAGVRIGPPAGVRTPRDDLHSQVG